MEASGPHFSGLPCGRRGRLGWSEALHLGGVLAVLVSQRGRPWPLHAVLRAVGGWTEACARGGARGWDQLMSRFPAGILGKGLGLSEPQLPELTVASLALSSVYRYMCTYVHEVPAAEASSLGKSYCYSCFQTPWKLPLPLPATCGPSPPLHRVTSENQTNIGQLWPEKPGEAGEPYVSLPVDALGPGNMTATLPSRRTGCARLSPSSHKARGWSRWGQTSRRGGVP